MNQKTYQILIREEWTKPQIISILDIPVQPKFQSKTFPSKVDPKTIWNQIIQMEYPDVVDQNTIINQQLTRCLNNFEAKLQQYENAYALLESVTKLA